MKPLNGIIPPLVTPLLDDATLDIAGLERLIEHVVGGGVHGIFILGTTGEAQSLGFDLKAAMIAQTVKILNGRLPLLVGISDTSVADSTRLAQVAAHAGADAVVSAPPYYFSTGQAGLVAFYRQLLEMLELPLFLYNIPVHTGISFAPDTIYRIAENEKVAGFKDSSANGTYLQSVMYQMRHRKDFSLFVGPEEMTAEAVLMGAHGGVNGGANMFPKLYVALYQAAAAGNIAEVRQLQTVVMQISATIYQAAGEGSGFLKGVKTALQLLGICNDYLAAPFNKCDEGPRAQIKQALEQLPATYCSLPEFH